MNRAVDLFFIVWARLMMALCAVIAIDIIWLLFTGSALILPVPT